MFVYSVKFGVVSLVQQSSSCLKLVSRNEKGPLLLHFDSLLLKVYANISA